MMASASRQRCGAVRMGFYTLFSFLRRGVLLLSMPRCSMLSSSVLTCDRKRSWRGSFVQRESAPCMNFMAVAAGLLLACLCIFALSEPSLAATWGPEMQVNVNDTSDDMGIRVAVDSAGTAWVFWMGIDAEQGDWEIYSSCWTGAGWTPEERVHADNAQNDSWPEACIGRDGIPWVVWERHRGGTSAYWDVLASHWTGAQWSEPETVLAAGGGEGQMYDIACRDSDLVWAVVATYVKRGTAYDLDLFFRNRQAGVWSELEHIDHPVIYDGYPGLVLSGLDIPWVAWRESSGLPFVLHCSRREDVGWRESLPPIQGDGPKLCFSGGRGPWISYLDSTSNVSALLLDADVWKVLSPVALLPHVIESEGDDAPNIAGVRGSGPVVVWAREDHRNSLRGDIYISRWSGCWWTAEELVTEPDSVLVAVDEWPVVGVSGEGRVWVVWRRSRGPDGADYDVWARYSDDFLAQGWIRSFDAHFDTGVVVLSWECPGRVGFNVYRSYAGACGGPEVEGERQLITPEPLREVQGFVDRGVEPGSRYLYWLQVVSSVGVCEESGPVLVRTCEGGTRVGLVGVRPNPSGAGFIIGYYSDEAARVELEVLDISSRVVRKLAVAGEEGEVLWDGRDEHGKEVSPGVYFVRCLVGRRPAGGVMKLVLLR